MLYKSICILATLLFGWAGLSAVEQKPAPPSSIPWVENTLDQMSIDEKIGQLITVRASTKKSTAEEKKILSQIRKYHIGGVCFFQGGPEQLAAYANTYQLASKLPLLVSIDGEWGLGMRYPKETISYPRQLMLGAIQDNNLIYEMGLDVADQLRRVGIHVNFAPVVDINNNPRNPVINNRSFGENKYNVAAKSYAYAKGMQDGGLLACAKHFPGHGDTDVDSHHGLPVIPYDRARLDSLELMPFKALAKQGIGSMMVAHLHMPQLDNRPNRPTTLSKPVIDGILRQEYGYDGLIFTDAMEMQGVAKHFPNGIADAEAIAAGNDIILLPNDIAATVKAIKTYLADGRLTENRIDQSVRRILKAKYDLGLHRSTPLVKNTSTLLRDLNKKKSLALKARLIENALTLVRDDAKLLPLRIGNDKKYAVLSIGSTQPTPFQKRIKSYASAKLIQVGKDIGPRRKEQLLNELSKHDHLIVSIHDMSKYASKNFGLTASILDLLEGISKQKPFTLVVFGSPYSLKYMDHVGTVVMAYEDDEMTQDIAAQSLFGANPIKGKLPVTASPKSVYGSGSYLASNGTLGYSLPERVGLSSTKMAKIDTIMQRMRDMKAAPGGQVFVAKDGKVVWNKSYGYHTYNRKQSVTDNDIYDVASVTKILATTISLMKLYDDGKFDLRSPLRRYLPEADTCDKRNLIMEDMLAHQARLPGWIPFYKSTVSDTKYPKPLTEYYSKTLSPGFNIPVADNLFLRSDYQDTIWSKILGCKLRDKDSYRYSDLSFYMMHRSLKQITNESIDAYAKRQFYDPLGLHHTGYLPLSFASREQIVPTEEDRYFRRQKLQGHVHDMGAAMLGGVAGHAGLFSNAHDLGVLMQMLLNGGHYGGRHYFSESTVKRFTSRYYRSTRRGIGFDMKETDDRKKPNMSELASSSTFGHLGFTGTAVFADPVHDIVYIFLSNRTYPQMKNNRLANKNIRPKVQSAIYESFIAHTHNHS